MIPIARPYTDEQEIAAVSEVLRSGMLAQGKQVQLFESEFAGYCRVSDAVAVNNGTSALHAALFALGIGNGDEVIVPDFTFFATASSVCMCGGKPVFAEVDENTFTITPATVQERITPKTKAVIGVHLFGQPFDVESIQEICENNGLFLVEDAAQAHGALYKGKKVGGFGDAACFSFYPTKNMTTGEGGMVTTNNPGLAEKVREFINHGQSGKYLHTCVGYNYRMTDIGAAIGRVQLKRLDSFNKRRQENARYYSSHISAKGISIPKVSEGVSHVYHQYVVRVTEECALTRTDLGSYLTEHGIGSAIHYPVPLHEQPAFRDLPSETFCPVSKQLAGEVLSIPVHPLVKKREREYICKIMNEVA